MLVWSYFFLIAVSLLILGIALIEFLNALNRFRGPRIVTCPADGKTVGVEIDAARAAASKVRGHGEEFRIAKCTSWPEREGCAEACTHQLEGDPDATLLRSRLAEWFAAHTCALCGRTIRVVPPDESGPGFLTSERRPIGWQQLPLENFPESLSRHAPLCASCRSAARA